MGSPFYVAAGRAACYTKGKRSVLGKKGAEMKGHRRGQQGAILVLTAFLLPFIIAFTGMAVDFGNLYVQHQRLQNAADAAVLAGAKAYAENNEKVDNHPKADERAKEYIVGQYHNLATDEEINAPQYKAKEYNKQVYYRVDLSKEVPLYFLSFIKKTQKVSVTSIASIEKKQKEENPGFFNNLLSFEKRLSFVNSINNPDKLDPKNPNYATDSKNMISSTFDGRIVSTTRHPFVKYSTQAPALDRIFTSAGKEKNKTHNINELCDPNEGRASFSKDGSLQSGEWTRVDYQEPSYDAFLKYVRDLSEGAPKVSDQNVNTSSAIFKNDVVVIPHTNQIPNVSLNIDSALDNTDKPLYIYIGKGMGNININLNTNMNRPIIICVDGDKNSSGPTVNFNIQGHTFKGAIFAPYIYDNPYSDQGSMIINAANSKFIGSIVTRSARIAGDNASFVFKDYTKSGNSGNSGGGNSESDFGKDSSIRLVSSPDGLSWS